MGLFTVNKMMIMMIVNRMQANKWGNSGASASVQLQATNRTMHNASLFQQKVKMLTTQYKTMKNS